MLASFIKAATSGRVFETTGKTMSCCPLFMAASRYLCALENLSVICRFRCCSNSKSYGLNCAPLAVYSTSLQKWRIGATWSKHSCFLEKWNIKKALTGIQLFICNVFCIYITYLQGKQQVSPHSQFNSIYVSCLRTFKEMGL